MENEKMKLGILKDIVEWDVINWSRAINHWKENTSLVLDNCSVLELGAGNGGLSLWLSLEGANVICSDLYGPNEKARQLHKKYGTEGNICYERIDATNIRYENYFDIVIFKSILGGIGRNDNFQSQVIAIKSIHRSLKTGGELFFAENLVGSWLHKKMRNKFVRWGKEWRYIALKEVDCLMEEFASYTVCSAGFLGAFGRGAFQRNLLGYIDKYILDKIISEDSKYICFGVARK